MGGWNNFAAQVEVAGILKRMITSGKDIRAILRTPIQRYYDAGMISSRAYLVCVGCEMYTVGELLRVYHDGDLPKLRNCGRKTIEELEKIVAPINKRHVIQLVNKLDLYEDLPEDLKYIFETNFRRPLMDFSLDGIKWFYATFNGPRSFYGFFCLDQKNLADRFNQLEIWELKHYCYQLLSIVHAEIRKKNLDGTLTYELVVIARNVLWFCDERFAEELEAIDKDLKIRRKALLDDFDFRIGLLPRDVKRHQRLLIPNYSKAAGMLLLSEEDVRGLLQEIRPWGMTYRELFHLLDGLNVVLFDYENLDKKEILKDFIAKKYHYLTEEQIDFVAEFVEQYGYYPMFFLLRERLAHSKEHLDMMFAMATGLCDGSSKNMAEIGKELEYSRERIRQLLETAPRDLFKDKDWRDYHFDSILVTSEIDDLYLNVVERETVNISFDVFAQVCTRGFPLKMAKVNDVRFLVNNRFSSQIIERICKEINRENRRIKSVIETICLGNLLKNVPDDKIEDYKMVMPAIVTKAYGLVVDDKGNIILPPNGVDVIYELSEILRSKGRPMSLAELFAELKERCPDVRYKKPEEMRGKILRSDIIKPIGISGRYALAEWNDVYRGSVRDLVADILKRAGTPLHIDVIMEKVLVDYPYTNKKSVASSLGSDKDRFVMIGEGYYGLRKKKDG